jgi:hypothetical protein
MRRLCHGQLVEAAPPAAVGAGVNEQFAGPMDDENAANFAAGLLAPFGGRNRFGKAEG